MKVNNGYVISLALIWAVLLFVIGDLHFVIWTAGVILLLANSIFVHRDLAAGQNLRAIFYAVFGTGGMMALFLNATFWASGAKPAIPENIKSFFLDSNDVLIAALGFVFAGAALAVVMRRHRKAE